MKNIVVTYLAMKFSLKIMYAKDALKIVKILPSFLNRCDHSSIRMLVVARFEY